MAQKETRLQLSGNLTGLAYSDWYNKGDTGEVNVIYQHDRCTSAWLEYENNDGATLKVPILPKAVSQPIDSGCKFRLVACIGNRGTFSARLQY